MGNKHWQSFGELNQSEAFDNAADLMMIMLEEVIGVEVESLAAFVVAVDNVVVAGDAEDEDEGRICDPICKDESCCDDGEGEASFSLTE